MYLEGFIVYEGQVSGRIKVGFHANLGAGKGWCVSVCLRGKGLFMAPTNLHGIKILFDFVDFQLHFVLDFGPLFLHSVG